MSHIAKQNNDLFYAKLEDLCDAVERKNIPKFTSFLDEKQQFLAQEYLERRHLKNWMLWGGEASVARKMLGVFPDYMEPDGEHFPISALTFSYRKEDTLTHRDFLGSLMALQMKREAIGDILVMTGNCVLFVTEKVEPLVYDELTKIGRIGVKIQQGITVPISCEQKFQELVGTVASMRLDCVIAMMTGKSRGAVCELIKAGLVSLNYQPIQSGSITVTPGDILTVRGYGKAKIAPAIQTTKKDRCRITLLKYI